MSRKSDTGSKGYPLFRLPWPSFYRERRHPRATQRERRGFWREETPPSARDGDVASSPPCMSMCCRYQHLGKVEVVRLHPYQRKPRRRPSSWSPSLLAPSAHVGVLILFSTDNAPGSNPAACRATGPGSHPSGVVHGERLDPEATHSPPEVLVLLIHLLWEEMGWPISRLDSMSCLSSWWA